MWILENLNTIRRTSSTIPFGWMLHPTVDGYLIEDIEEQDALAYVKERLENLSTKQIIDTLHARTGRKLTKRGLKKILNRKY